MEKSNNQIFQSDTASKHTHVYSISYSPTICPVKNSCHCTLYSFSLPWPSTISALKVFEKCSAVEVKYNLKCLQNNLIQFRIIIQHLESPKELRNTSSLGIIKSTKLSM